MIQADGMCELIFDQDSDTQYGLQARQISQGRQEHDDMKHQAQLAAVRADQTENELRRLRSVLTESSDLQDSARRVCEPFLPAFCSDGVLNQLS